jgi:ribokinase
MTTGTVAVLGIFVVDVAYRTHRRPAPGETVLGTDYGIGPGGKGSNQAVAAARAGARVDFITRLGRDGFGEMGRALWAEAGVVAHVTESDRPTGSAGIIVDAATGENAIVVCAGAAAELSADDVDRAADALARADVFCVQLEQDLAVAHHALRRARAAGCVTVLNPAPATDLPDGMLSLCDWVVPNESEAAALTGIPVDGPESAALAGRALLGAGAGGAVVTLGARGALVVTAAGETHVPAVVAGEAVDTTGAGDAFTGAFCAALATGLDAVAAARFAAVAAGIAVTRRGAAAAMPTLDEIEAVATSR